MIFDKVNVCTGDWVHLTIVNNYANKKAYCYINGELIQEKSAIKPVANSGPVMLGNDFRDNSKRPFKGQISSVAVYTDVRTQVEIKGDMDGCGKDGLLATWDFNRIPTDGNIVDLSGNGYNIKWMWIKEKEKVEDFAHSFVVVGDTQSVNIYDSNNFSTI